MRPADKVALVTGAASGLGLATARALRGAGAKVAAMDMDERVHEVAKSLGDEALGLQADVSDEASVAAAIEQLTERFGPLDIAVNCAGVAPPARVLGRNGPHSLQKFSDVIRINLIGTFNVARLAAAAMAVPRPDEEWGVIVNTSSIAAFDGQAGQAAYAASKGGVASLTLPFARDLARSRIRCVAIAPGVFKTQMVADLPEGVESSLAAKVPHPNRLGDPLEFAALVIHVIENPMLNGEVIRLDGALRMD